jgi:hypothetical protein
LTGAAGLVISLSLCANSTAQSYGLRESIPFSYPGFTANAVPAVRGSAGDWNGDGTPDIAIHYSGFIAAMVPGRLRVYSGFDFSIVQEWVGNTLLPLYFAEENPGAGMGGADLDLDGQVDLLIGTPEGFLGSSAFVGTVTAASGGTSFPLYTVWGEQPWDGFGGSVTVVGDTSGNGVADYLVYAEGADGPSALNVGALYLIEGADGSLRYEFLAPFACAYCGATADDFGDLDADGVGDFAIPMPGWNGATGKVTIYSGLTVPTVVREHFGTQPGWSYGAGAVRALGDADADGVGDYVISANTWGGPTPVTAPGQAWLYSGASGTQLTTYIGPPGTLRLGTHGDVLDDVDGDGVNELALSSSTPGTTNGYPSSGNVLVFSGLSGAVLQVIDNPPIGSTNIGNYQGFGAWLSSIGDIDEDGHADFAVGRNPGPAFVFTRDIVSVAPNPVPLGSTATFSFDVPAQPAAPYHLLLSFSAATGIPILTRVFPLDLDPFFVLSLLNPSLGGLLDSTGAAVVAISVPADPGLSGLQLQFAGVTLSPSSPFGVRTIGNAKTVSIQ